MGKEQLGPSRTMPGKSAGVPGQDPSRPSWISVREGGPPIGEPRPAANPGRRGRFAAAGHWIDVGSANARTLGQTIMDLSSRRRTADAGFKQPGASCLTRPSATRASPRAEFEFGAGKTGTVATPDPAVSGTAGLPGPGWGRAGRPDVAGANTGRPSVDTRAGSGDPRPTWCNPLIRRRLRIRPPLRRGDTGGFLSEAAPRTSALNSPPLAPPLHSRGECSIAMTPQRLMVNSIVLILKRGARRRPPPPIRQPTRRAASCPPFRRASDRCRLCPCAA